MREMEVAKPERRNEDEKAADSGNEPAEPLRAEGGAMDCFVQRREQEDQENALDRQKQRPVGQAGDDGNAERQNRSEMQGEAQQAVPVGQAGERGALRWRK